MLSARHHIRKDKDACLNPYEDKDIGTGYSKMKETTGKKCNDQCVLAWLR
jgi:hypothetical protein